MSKSFYRLKAEIDSLAVFSDIKTDPVIASLRQLLEAMADRDTDLSIKLYSQFVSELYQTTACLTDSRPPGRQFLRERKGCQKRNGKGDRHGCGQRAVRT